MKTTKRFDRSVRILYSAFHNGTLDAMDCEHCAVGNLCNNSDEWAFLSHEDSYIGLRPEESLIQFQEKTGYSPKELNTIETLFMWGVRNHQDSFKFMNDIPNNLVARGWRTKEEQKELQFKGLCAVIEYLAELDGIPNPMDYTKLFERTEEGQPKYML